jgi:MFS family permease
MLCNIGSAVATSFEGLLAARLVASITGSATEALSAAFVNVCYSLVPVSRWKKLLTRLNQDLFFLHERGHKMMVYIIFLASGNSIGPLVSGFVITSM